jgi:hypothetical protein
MMVSVTQILDVDIGYFYDELPKQKLSGEIETPALTELALSFHGRRLINAFLNLKIDKLRGAVADFAPRSQEKTKVMSPLRALPVGRHVRRYGLVN